MVYAWGLCGACVYASACTQPRCGSNGSFRWRRAYALLLVPGDMYLNHRHAVLNTGVYRMQVAANKLLGWLHCDPGAQTHRLHGLQSRCWAETMFPTALIKAVYKLVYKTCLFAAQEFLRFEPFHGREKHATSMVRNVHTAAPVAVPGDDEEVVCLSVCQRAMPHACQLPCKAWPKTLAHLDIWQGSQRRHSSRWQPLS